MWTSPRSRAGATRLRVAHAERGDPEPEYGRCLVQRPPAGEDPPRISEGAELADFDRQRYHHAPPRPARGRGWRPR
jgi:hypothetical protein